MSKFKVKFDDLEEFADKIGKVDRECDEALEALNWHFTSLLSNSRVCFRIRSMP
ncbi:hypothetical protein [Caldibacillus thermoamylovorans]|uniref:hypothetical protein n=1 Tax=Caldibacillus thermoamylovorans TaxID=35841 RepID=UPI00203DA812|nr:hypothetical protein [Caldibacillus thermoamylovorans]MCM3056541.1 hypothetical protein [Caldibacillus thermoamylovorans]